LDSEAEIGRGASALLSLLLALALCCFFSEVMIFLLTGSAVRRGLGWLLAREVGLGGAWTGSGSTFSFVLRNEVVWGVCGGLNSWV
jgi:hypothetical protein